ATPAPATAAPPQPAASVALPPAPPRDPVWFDVRVHGGIAGRLGSSQYFDVSERAGLVVGASLAASPSRWYAVGLGYEHTTLGRDSSPITQAGTASVRRSLDALWLALRLNFVQTTSFGWYITLGPGLAFQHESASGVAFPGIGKQPVPFACSASDSAR